MSKRIGNVFVIGIMLATGSIAQAKGIDGRQAFFLQGVTNWTKNVVQVKELGDNAVASPMFLRCHSNRTVQASIGRVGAMHIIKELGDNAITFNDASVLTIKELDAGAMYVPFVKQLGDNAMRVPFAKQLGDNAIAASVPKELGD